VVIVDSKYNPILLKEQKKRCCCFFFVSCVYRSIYTAARTLSTDNSNGNGIAPTGTLEEEDEEQQQELDQNDSLLNANIIFENSIMASEYLRAPRLFLRPGSRAYSVPANLGKFLFLI
jgi:hypothetical protein